MLEFAEWVALAATCIAALMTASNLGARVTGWGFVVFTIGAAAWAFVGLNSHQAQLLWSNSFLGIVDLFGIWRWLGLRARFGDASRAAERESERKPGDTLLSAISLDGMAVTGRDGATIGHVTDALITCIDGGIAFLVVREGGVAGIGETLRQLPWSEARVGDKTIDTRLDPVLLAQFPIAEAA